MNDLEGSGEHTSPPSLQGTTNQSEKERNITHDAASIVEERDPDLVQTSRQASSDEKRGELLVPHDEQAGVLRLRKKSKSSSDIDEKKKKKSPLLFRRLEEKSLWKMSKEEMMDIVQKREWKRAYVRDFKKWEGLASAKGIEEVARMLRPIAFFVYRDKVILVFRGEKGLLWKNGPKKKNWGNDEPLRSVILQEGSWSEQVGVDNAEEVFTRALMHDYQLERSRRIFVYSFQSVMSSFDNQVQILCSKFSGVVFFMNLTSNDVDLSGNYLRQHDILILDVPLDGRILFSDEQGRYGKIFKKLYVAKQRLQVFPKCVLVLRNDSNASDVDESQLISPYCDEILKEQHDVKEFFSIIISIDNLVAAERENVLKEAIKTCWKKRERFPDTCLDWSSEWCIPKGVALKCAFYAFKKDCTGTTANDQGALREQEKSSSCPLAQIIMPPSEESFDEKMTVTEIADDHHQEGKTAEKKKQLQIAGSVDHLPGADEKLKRSESLRIVRQATDESEAGTLSTRRALSLRTKAEKNLIEYVNLSRSTGKPPKLLRPIDPKQKAASTSTSPINSPRESECNSPLFSLDVE